jgi:hypothetical protein
MFLCSQFGCFTHTKLTESKPPINENKEIKDTQ